MITKYNIQIYDYIFSCNIESDNNLSHDSEKERINKLHSLFKNNTYEYDFWDENKYDFCDDCVTNSSTMTGPQITYCRFPRIKGSTRLNYLEYKANIIKTDIHNYGEFNNTKFIEDTSNMANIARKEILDYANEKEIIIYSSKVYFAADNDPSYIIMYGNIRANHSLLANEENDMPIFSKNTKHKKYDVFISHSSLDKDFVRELCNSLAKLEVTYFLDDKEFTWGDNWKDKLFESIKQSEFAIIIISKNFFDREWTEIELNEFLKLQKSNYGQKLILPLLYGITLEELKNRYPSLSGIQALIYNPINNNCNEIALSFAAQLIKKLKQEDEKYER